MSWQIGAVMWSSLQRTVASLDITDVNKWIKRTRHTIPTLQELESSLDGAKYFSHLYTNNSYMQLNFREQKADHILNTLQTQAFQGATL